MRSLVYCDREDVVLCADGCVCNFRNNVISFLES